MAAMKRAKASRLALGGKTRGAGTGDVIMEVFHVTRMENGDVDKAIDGSRFASILYFIMQTSCNLLCMWAELRHLR